MSEYQIELPDSLTIHHIEEVYGNLKIAFQSDAETYKIAASAVESIDTSGLQALLALVKNAVQNQKEVLWDSPSESLTSSASKLGLTEKLRLA